MLELRRRRAPAGARPDSAPSAAGEPALEAPALEAVVDIGSNSIRMIIYRREGRAFWPIFNEKLLAGLGRGLAETGRLSEEGAAQALRTLRRFRMILDAHGVEGAAVFATAAVREAEDGRDFAAEVGRCCGFDVRILSGEEEGRLSALGVIAGGAGGPGGAGLVGDLGGSSLELCHIADGRPGRGVTMALGPLTVLESGRRDRAALRAIMDSALDEADPLFDGVEDFYAVGGAWRNLARVDMTLRGYTLPLLHHYEMSRAQARRTAVFLASQSPESLGPLPDVSPRRAPLLPYAALLLERILERGRFGRVVISAYGVREGALFDRMAPDLRARDPLIEGARAYARRLAPGSKLDDSLADWIAPVFDGAPDVLGPGREPVLRRAGAVLSDIGSAMHPEHRAELAADQVLYAPFAGLDHKERAFLATAIFHRYRGAPEPPADFVPRNLASPDVLERARAVGLALRLGCVLSARAPRLLAQASLEASEGVLRLRVGREGEPLITDHAEKRLKQLGSALSLKPEIVTPD